MNKNSICSLIVKKYQLHKIKETLNLMKPNIKLLNNFIDLRLQPAPLTMIKSDWINKNYDELTKFLFNKILLQQVNDFINQYNKFYKIDENIRSLLTSKKILSIWLILAFPEFIIDTNLEKININNQDYKTDLYVLTKELHNNLMLLLDNYDNKELIRKFNKKLNLYINSLDYYLKINKREKLNTYIKEWIDIEKSINLINTSNKYNNYEKEQATNILINSKQLIEKYINMFTDNSENIYTKLKEIALYQINLDNNLKLSMDNILNLELKNNNYENLKKILEQIKIFILSFTKTPENIVNELIDIEYIIQLIKHDVLTINEINTFGLSLLNNICLAGSISLNEQQLKEWNEIIINYKDDYKLIIGKLLRLSLESISLIIEEIACFQEYLLLIK